MKVLDVTGRIKCLNGLLVSLNAILLIWEDLKQNHNFKFLFTRRLNTDPLETFFGTIRQQGGNFYNSSPTQFTRAFRKLLFSSLLNSSTGNCAEDLDSLLSQFSSNSNNAVLVHPPSQPQTLNIGGTDYRELDVSSSIVKENAVAYVAGYLLKKCFDIHQCSSCKEILASTNLDSSSKLLCYFKNYKDDNSSRLQMPSQCFLDYILRLEDSFVKHFSVYTKSTKVGDDLLKIFKSMPVNFQQCPAFPMEYMLKLFLRMRIYYTIKFANRDFASTPKKKSRKYIKVSHL